MADSNKRKDQAEPVIPVNSETELTKEELAALEEFNKFIASGKLDAHVSEIFKELYEDLESKKDVFNSNLDKYKTELNQFYERLQEYLKKSKAEKRPYHVKTGYTKKMDVNVLTSFTNLNMFNFRDTQLVITNKNNNNSLLYINLAINNLNNVNFNNVFILANLLINEFYERGYNEFTTEQLAKYYYGSKAYKTDSGKTTYTKMSEDKRQEINKIMYVLSHIVADHIVLDKGSVEYKPLFNISSNSINLENDSSNATFKFTNNNQFYIKFVKDKRNSYELEFTSPLKSIGKSKDKLEDLQNFLEYRLVLMNEDEETSKFITAEDITKIYKVSSRKGKIEAVNNAREILKNLAKEKNIKIRTSIDNTGRGGAIRGIKVTFL